MYRTGRISVRKMPLKPREWPFVELRKICFHGLQASDPKGLGSKPKGTFMSENQGRPSAKILLYSSCKNRVLVKNKGMSSDSWQQKG